eukprot:4494730-Pyramimonas_sp.AAC.1
MLYALINKTIALYSPPANRFALRAIPLPLGACHHPPLSAPRWLRSARYVQTQEELLFTRGLHPTPDSLLGATFPFRH